MPRVLVAPALLNRQPGPHEEVLRAAGLEIVYPENSDALYDIPTLIENLAGIDAVVAGMEPFSPEVLAASRLRVIARVGVGYDAIDIPAASSRGVAVTITPGTNEISVAEQAIALIIGVFRGNPWRDRSVREGTWIRRSLPRLCGKTLGLVGMGRIGRAVVSRARGLGMRVIAADPFADKAFAAANDVTLCELDELWGQADVISLHAPATPETYNLINAETIAKMKPTAVVVNTARGTLVDEDALAEALASGRLFGAGLDVFKTEPLPSDSPLHKLDNVLMSPHMGGLDEESQEAMTRLAAQCVADLYQGKWPEGCVVNDELRDGWAW
ncbi:MAG: phosphoglycerate dehydrogenase [Pirellulales bacterium]